MSRLSLDLSGRVAVVTGAASGIGRGIARAYAEMGAKVIAADIGSAADIPDGAEYARLDVRDAEASKALAAKVVEKHGRVDILANVAGISEFGLTSELSLAEWTKTLDVNLTGTFLCCQAFGKPMLRRRSGKIINIGSRCGYAGLPFHIAYNASKAGIIALTQTLAIEWGSHGINVNAIVPGFVRSNMTKDTIADPTVLKVYESKIPLGRISEPEDLVGPAVFLASSASDYVTGAALVSDGGNLASGGVGAEIRNTFFRSMREGGEAIPDWLAADGPVATAAVPK
jgi:NAD(P)-dependent dehydrogenase (short-subunit alcohol dehydrogenase family)